VQDQLTVRLPADLRRALQRASRRLQRKNSDIVRLALQAFLQADERLESKPADRVRGLIGSLDSGVSDLATRHREYILESIKRGR
jgi:metal-responsive CopG/Arc/MetJ family transcriptional regulator